jgi:hypothetical protein
VSHWSSSIWIASPSAATPALLTSAMTGPSSSSTCLNSSSGAPLVTSAWNAAALPPASSIAFTVAFAPSSSER